jgi:hypothetical protein
MIRNACLAAVLATGLAGTCHADIYKCTDPSGHVTYTNQKTPDKGCALLSKDQAVSTVPGARPAARPGSPSPAGFPKVDSDTQKQRDTDRRKILEQELSAEEKSLEQARKELSEQEAVRFGDEKNYQRVIDRLQPYKDKVALHERNIEALKREMGNLR